MSGCGCISIKLTESKFKFYIIFTYGLIFLNFFQLLENVENVLSLWDKIGDGPDQFDEPQCAHSWSTIMVQKEYQEIKGIKYNRKQEEI